MPPELAPHNARFHGNRGRLRADNERSFLRSIFVEEHDIPQIPPASEASEDTLEVESTRRFEQLQVTREDIGKPGLEVFTAQNLLKYVKDGKVLPGFVDQCFICLEDYSNLSEVRVLKCRHAFHRFCVDKWMDVGDNNCPVCRSTGDSNETCTYRRPYRSHYGSRLSRSLSIGFEDYYSSM